MAQQKTIEHNAEASGVARIYDAMPKEESLQETMKEFSTTGVFLPIGKPWGVPAMLWHMYGLVGKLLTLPALIPILIVSTVVLGLGHLFSDSENA